MIAFYDHLEHGYRWEVDGKVAVDVYTHPSEVGPEFPMAGLIDARGSTPFLILEQWELRLA